MMRIVKFFKPVKDSSMEALISELISADGISYHTIATSVAIRRLFTLAGFHSLPRSATSVKKVVDKYANQIKLKEIQQISQKKKDQKKFSLTVDEWTAKSNKRYVNLNLHEKNTHVNLGLIPVPIESNKSPGSLDGTGCIKLVDQRLQDFGVDMKRDIVCCISDGAAMMLKFSKLSQQENGFKHQVCFAHGLQLGVLDVLYKKDEASASTKRREDKDSNLESSDTESESESESEIEENSDEYEVAEEEVSESESETDAGILSTTVELSIVDVMHPKISLVIKKVRFIVRMFRKSPVKWAFLAKQMKNDLNIVLRPILDCKTRWSSLFSMIQRYLKIYSSINKSIIDLRTKKKRSPKKKIPIISEDEITILEEVVNALEVVKVALENCAGKMLLSCHVTLYWQ